jgi:hypothetical protein
VAILFHEKKTSFVTSAVLRSVFSTYCPKANFFPLESERQLFLLHVADVSLSPVDTCNVRNKALNSAGHVLRKVAMWAVLAQLLGFRAEGEVRHFLAIEV